MIAQEEKQIRQNPGCGQCAAGQGLWRLGALTAVATLLQAKAYNLSPAHEYRSPDRRPHAGQVPCATVCCTSTPAASRRRGLVDVLADDAPRRKRATLAQCLAAPALRKSGADRLSLAPRPAMSPESSRWCTYAAGCRVNLPMLLRRQYRHESLDMLVARALSGGTQCIMQSCRHGATQPKRKPRPNHPTIINSSAHARASSQTQTGRQVFRVEVWMTRRGPTSTPKASWA